MTARMPSLATAIVLVLACSVGGAANMSLVTADIAFGAHVSGPAIGPDGLAGRVVVLEFWGINCPPCIASMPKLEAMHRELSPQGLVVVGAHAQGGPVADIAKVVSELGVTFTIVEQATVNNGMDFDGIPHCMVFDHTGTCVYRGSPGDAHDAVVAALQAAPQAILAGRSFTKLAALGEMLRTEADYGSVLKRARGLLESKDTATADDARFIVERLEGRGREMLDQAQKLADTDPYAATLLAQRCAAAFKGCDIGGEAGKLLMQWKKDKDFQSGYRSGQQLARLEELRAAAARVPGGVPPQAKLQAVEIARLIEKNWPGSGAATKAAAIVSEMSGDVAAKP